MSFWKNLAKYALMAAPIVAAPFTGGASLLAIGALSGAAGGALGGGGVKGALLGGALGAIPGVGGVGGKAAGAAMPTLTAGLKQAGMQAAKGAATNAAIGGGVGALTGGGKGALTGALAGAAGGIGSGGGSMATTGTSSAILNALKQNGPAIAGAAGAAMAGAAKGKAADRTAADAYGIQRDQLGMNAANINERALADRARLDLDQHTQATKSGTEAFQNALRASVVQNFKPAVRPNGVANISFIGGGPSAGAKASAAAMEHEAMQRLLTGEQYAPQAAFSPYQLASSATPQKAGTLENVMGILGTGMSGYAGISKDIANQKMLAQAQNPAGVAPVGTPYQPVGLTMPPPKKPTLFDYDPIPVNP